jgi:hypothetical protein
MSTRPAMIAELNDLLRTTFLTGEVVFTQGVCALDRSVREDVLTKVRKFHNFTPDNDPHGEHDFGAIKHDLAGWVFWKIDYYDRSYEFHSPDATDPSVTCRVLTIMLAEEY